MTFAFDPHQGLIVVPTEITGPSGTAVLRLALDTGATSTLVNVPASAHDDDKPPAMTPKPNTNIDVATTWNSR